MTMHKLFLLLTAASLFAADPDASGAKQVMAAMESMKQAMLHKDGPALEKLLHADLTYTHSQGQLDTKADLVKAVASGKANIQKLEFTNPIVNVYGNTALVKGRVDLWHSETNIVHMHILHVWLKGTDGWKLVSRQATRLAN